METRTKLRRDIDIAMRLTLSILLTWNPQDSSLLVISFIYILWLLNSVMLYNSTVPLAYLGKDESGQRMEIVELDDHPFYCAVQFHPEYLSRPLRPSAPYLGLILAASGQLTSYLKNPESLKHGKPTSMF